MTTMDSSCEPKITAQNAQSNHSQTNMWASYDQMWEFLWREDGYFLYTRKPLLFMEKVLIPMGGILVGMDDGMGDSGWI